MLLRKEPDFSTLFQIEFAAQEVSGNNITSKGEHLYYLLAPAVALFHDGNRAFADRHNGGNMGNHRGTRRKE
jgi:hypothetical protein